MPPRKRKAEPAPEQLLDIEDAISEQEEIDYSKVKPAELIAEHLLLKKEVEDKTKIFNAFIEPMSTRMEAIRQLLHGKALHDGVNAFSTDNGTAYLSRIVSHKIDPEAEYTSLEGRVSRGRDALLDWLLDNWEEYGSEGIQVGVSKDIVERWMNDKVDDPQWNDKPPPGLKLDVLVRCNIKKS
jgi:hypothetical protein